MSLQTVPSKTQLLVTDESIQHRRNPVILFYHERNRHLFPSVYHTASKRTFPDIVYTVFFISLSRTQQVLTGLF